MPSEKHVSYAVADVLTLSLDYDSEQWSCRGEGTPEIVIVIDGQQIIVAGIHIRDKKLQIDEQEQRFDLIVELFERAWLGTADRPSSLFGFKLLCMSMEQ